MNKRDLRWEDQDNLKAEQAERANATPKQPTGQRTPGPWKAQGGGIIVGHRPGSDLPLAVADILLPIHNGKEYEMQRANAVFICRACNSHDALVETLQEVKEWFITHAKEIPIDTINIAGVIKAEITAATKE